MALLAVFQAYAPVLRGPFLFDDDYLPFRVPGFGDALGKWMMGVRPLLMLTYWVNYRISPGDTLWYHVLNVLFHYGAGVMMFLILRRILALAGVEEIRRTVLGAFGAGLFLLHPVQTEAVAYVASRSENLSVLLAFAAYAIFLCRRAEAVSWARAAAVLLPAAAAAGVKEHTIVLPALLLLTDYYWNPGFSFQGIRRNWRLYVPLAAVAAVGLVTVRTLLGQATTAGFGIKGLAWYEYFFTQCRALFVYLRLFVLPFGQTVDYDFPVSRTVFDRGAIFGLAALVAISVAAWIWRRRYPLASFGWFAFLILMAPTSSFVPIKDPVAERRLYLSMFGLLLIAMEALRRVRWRPAALAAVAAGVLLVFGTMTFARNLVWSDRIALWEDTVRKSPANARAHFQLAFAHFEEGRCADALPHYQRVEEIQGRSYDLLVDWALAYDCLNRPEEAMAKLRQAADGGAYRARLGAHRHDPRQEPALAGRPGGAGRGRADRSQLRHDLRLPRRHPIVAGRCRFRHGGLPPRPCHRARQRTCAGGPGAGRAAVAGALKWSRSGSGSTRST